MELFVKKNSKFDVEVYIWEDPNGNVDATHDKTLIPAKANPETLVFTFRRPTYLDSTTIMKQSNVKGTAENMDLANFQEIVLKTLLSDWNLKDEDGNPVPIRGGQAVNNLQPAIARAACAGCLEKVTLF